MGDHRDTNNSRYADNFTATTDATTNHIQISEKLNITAFIAKPTVLNNILCGPSLIRGITVLADDFFVLTVRSFAIVDVYNASSFSLNRSMWIHKKYPSDLSAIVAIAEYNSLYVCDTGQMALYRFNLSDDVVTRWPIDGKCIGMSKTSSGNLLATVWEPYRILEYSPDGILIREISLDRTIYNPHHSIQLPEKQFVVSHGGRIQNRVCLVNEFGFIQRCYGGDPGSGANQLYSPVQMAVSEDGNVLVSDMGNDRVVVFNRELLFLGYLSTTEQVLSRPYAIHLDERNHRLYIGEMSGNLIVYIV